MNQHLATLTLALAVLSGNAHAAPLPYDESADAQQELKQALLNAKTGKKPLLIVFGANWCGDCRALDTALKTTQNAQMVQQEFVSMKVDVGNFDRNLDIANAYGNPIKKGIPAAVIISPEGKLLYATKAGELASARKMSDTGVFDFFHQALEKARAAH